MKKDIILEKCSPGNQALMLCLNCQMTKAQKQIKSLLKLISKKTLDICYILTKSALWRPICSLNICLSEWHIFHQTYLL